MSAFVSVVMSIYNPNERYLAEQLGSIDSQDWDNMEIIVYNDNPDDEDRSAFCEAACPAHGVSYVHGERNLGYLRAFEQLVQLARGDYIAFADQDDVWLPGRISKCVSVMEQGGYLLCTCDRQIIDVEGEVVVPSWRAEHKTVRQDAWRTGDHILPYAAFSCFSIGMATMAQKEAAIKSLPYPSSTGHDRWLALCCGEMGRCAYVEEPLVQYRRHGKNVSGLFAGVYCKNDWMQNRVELSYQVVKAFGEKFPDSPDLSRMKAFANARKNGDVRGIWRNRDLAPEVARFEIVLHFTPDCLFRAFVRHFS